MKAKELAAPDDERRRMACWLGAPAAGGPAPKTALERAERLLLRGELSAAGRALDAALSRDDRDPWAFACRAALRFQEGDFSAASADVASFQSLKPGSPAGYAMRALLAASRGDEKDARSAINDALKRRDAPWIRAVRGMLLARWGELDAARADLDAALKAEAAPWVYAERADVLNRLGFFWLALEDLDRMRAAMPGDAEADLRAASIHLDQAQYKGAVTRLNRALKLRTDDPAILRRRAQVRLVQGDGEAAVGDLRRACELAPRDPDLKREHVRALTVSGRDSEAERELESPRLSDGVKRFCLGYLRCRQRRYAESRALFEAAAGLEPGLAERAAFYAVVSRVLKEAPPASWPRGKRMTIIGLGYRQPFQVSVESLSILRDTELLCSNLSDTAVADFLGLFPAPMKAIVFRRADLDAIQCAKDVMPGFDNANRVTVVTRGIPLYYGRLAYRLAVKCRRKRIPVLVPPSVSVGDTILSLVDHARGEELGCQVRDSSELGSLDARVPLVIYNFARESALREKTIATLSARYHGAHPCWLLSGSSDREFIPREAALKTLGAALDKADEAVTVLLPALKK